MTICEKRNCTGCGACVSACPHNCISLQPFAEDGHIYPVVDEQICVSCGLCQKICPQNTGAILCRPQNVYAGWSLNKEEHCLSASGGLASYFSRKILESGGVVYGCSSEISQQKITHIRCETEQDLKKLRGSKYAQSEIGDCFIRCQADLQAGKDVLFVGTPCQIGGLRAFLKKTYDNLYTADLVCHGVVPLAFLFEHLKTLNVVGDIVAFRTPNGMRLTVYQNGEETFSASRRDDIYYIGFLQGLFFRDSCYACQYAKAERVGDITLADFWGLGKEIPFQHSMENGVSLLLVNTEQGRTLLDKFSDGLFLEERTLDEAKKENGNLHSPSPKHKNTEKFKKLYKKYGFDKAAKKSLRKERWKYKIVQFSDNSKLVRKIIRLLRGGDR